MKFVDEYRDAGLARKLADAIARAATRPWTIMEICGGQTHAIMRYGLDEMLGEAVELVHGPGCPVCVTPLEMIDQALAIAARPGVIFTSYGDMLRVPGSGKDLFTVRAQGGDVRVVYSPLEAVKLARANPDRQVVFFAIGFETTAPANAMAVVQAKELGLENFSMLVSHVCVPPAIEAILSSPTNRVQAFLTAGHVCAVMGYWEYPPLAQKYQVPMVVTGFEPVDLLRGILAAVKQLESGRAESENAYERAVTLEGNVPAQAILRRVFQPCDRQWRGIGLIPQSGYALTPEFAAYDAGARFGVSDVKTAESTLCIAGQILQGWKKPFECPAYGKECTPNTPLGATMVSSEGACAAYYRYRRFAPVTMVEQQT
jgi:hydrogenase expression/formation protein HypD